MKYEVEEWKQDLKTEKAMSRLGAVFNHIHDLMPDLIFDIYRQYSGYRHTVTKYLNDGRSIDYDELCSMVTCIEKMIGVDCRSYRMSQEEIDELKAKHSYKFRVIKEKVKKPQDRYHFLCYVRDLIKRDKELFNALRVYATL